MRARTFSLAVIAMFASIVPSALEARDNGQFGDVSPNIRDWFRGVRSPHGVPCCDIADGHLTTWRGAREGGYEVPIEGQWRKVPDEAVVLDSGNPMNEAVVWYYRQGVDTYYIRCFVPGDGV